MKKLPGRLVLAALLWFTAGVHAQDPNFYIFLCLGQSNMEGFPGIPEAEKTFADERFQMLIFRSWIESRASGTRPRPRCAARAVASARSTILAGP